MKEWICSLLPSGGVHDLLVFSEEVLLKVRNEKYSCSRMFQQNFSLSSQIVIRWICFYVRQKDKPCSSNMKCSSESL